MRIGLVCPYALDVPGGVQNHVVELAAALVARGHHVGVLAPGPRPVGAASYVETTGSAYGVRFNGSVARVGVGLGNRARVRRWLREGKFDLLHVHEPFAPGVSMRAVLSSDVPVVATFHSASDRSRTLQAAATLAPRVTAKLAARIAVSEAARRTLVEHLGGEPLVIANGVDVDAFAAAPRTADGPPTVVFVGRVNEPRKGLPVLLAAWPEIRAAHPDAVLRIAGPGSADCGALVADLEGISLEGQPTDTERAALLATADVFVAPHLRGESFGIVLVEALASGAAIAASSLPAFRAVLDGGRLGQLFDPGDPASLAKAVVRLLSDDARRTTLAREGVLAARRFDWEAIVPEIEAIYEAVGEPAEVVLDLYLRERARLAEDVAALASDDELAKVARRAIVSRLGAQRPDWAAESRLTEAVWRSRRHTVDAEAADCLARIEVATRRASAVRRIHNDVIRSRRDRRQPAPAAGATIEYDDGARS